MEWLKDKKNLPIVATIAAVLLVVAGVVVWMQMSGGSSTTDSTGTAATATVDPNAGAAAGTAATDPSGAAGMGAPAQSPGGAAGTPSPGAATPPGTAAPTTGAAPAGTAQTASAKPMETWRDDPFLPVGYKPRKIEKPKPRIYDFPMPDLPRPVPVERLIAMIPEPPQPVRRMSGILLNDRIYAIIETNGKSEIVSPGARLDDGLATVERIEADKVVLKTTTKKPRFVVVRMASAPRTAGAASASGSASPYGANPFPGASGRRPSNMPTPNGPPM